MGFPLDLSFPTWVGGPSGSPSKPGASDLNKIQQSVLDVSDPPMAKLGRTDVKTIASSFTPTILEWNVAVQITDSALLSPSITASGSGSYTDRYVISYPGEWEVTTIVRAQYNNTSGFAQTRLLYKYLSTNTGGVLDVDVAPCNAVFPHMMRMVTKVRFDSARIAAGAYVYVDYAQNSGGNAAIYTSHQDIAAGVNIYPAFNLRWVGRGGVS